MSLMLKQASDANYATMQLQNDIAKVASDLEKYADWIYRQARDFKNKGEISDIEKYSKIRFFMRDCAYKMRGMT